MVGVTVACVTVACVTVAGVTVACLNGDMRQPVAGISDLFINDNMT